MNIVNGKLIFQLSLFGLLMALGTVFFIPTKIEPVCWLLIFVFCACVIARSVSTAGMRFLHGFCLGLANCVWVTAAHLALVNRYLAGHPDEKSLMRQLPMHAHPRLSMLLVGAAIGIVSGCVIGLFSVIAGLLFKKPAGPGKAMSQTA